MTNVLGSMALASVNPGLAAAYLVSSAVAGSSSTNLQFPPELGTAPNFMQIFLCAYSTNLRKDSQMVPQSVISLPMPISGLKNSFSMDFEQASLGSLGGIGATIGEMVNNGGVPGGAASTLGAAVSSGFMNSARRLAGSLAGILGDTATSAAQLGFGAVRNPNIGVLFKGMPLRNHEFTWQLVGNNAQESGTIKSIVQTLLNASIPSREDGANFALNYPNVAFPTFHGAAQDLVIFSVYGCFITNIEVNYSINGQSVAFFKDTNDPVMTTITIRMVERGIVAGNLGSGDPRLKGTIG